MKLVYGLTGLLILSVGCSQKTGFSSTNASAVNAACSGSIVNDTAPTKMLFVVDTSGSNQGSVGCTLSSTCTDPGKTIRAGSIQRFLNDYGSHTNFGWDLETFQDGAAHTITAPSFTSASGMQTAINNFMNVIDQGGTPYLAALDQAASTIQADPSLHTANSRYIVVFMSDGQPDNSDAATNILTEVSSIMNLSPGQITVNTVYYGVADPVASGLLSDMSTRGMGHFLDTNSNPTGLDFSISDLINGSCTQ